MKYLAKHTTMIVNEGEKKFNIFITYLKRVFSILCKENSIRKWNRLRFGLMNIHKKLQNKIEFAVEFRGFIKWNKKKAFSHAEKELFVVINYSYKHSHKSWHRENLGHSKGKQTQTIPQKENINYGLLRRSLLRTFMAEAFFCWLREVRKPLFVKKARWYFNKLLLISCGFSEFQISNACNTWLIHLESFD